MCVHYLHWLMSTALCFPSAFCWLCKLTIGEMMLMEGSNLAVGTNIAPTNIDAFMKESLKTGENQPLSVHQVSCTKAYK